MALFRNPIVPAMLLASITAMAFPDASAWNPEQLIEPAELAHQIQAHNGAPMVVFVGFPMLYRAAHIPQAVLAGPCSKPEGLDRLTSSMRAIPRDRRVVIYCGCCPFVHCPNVKPAYDALTRLGFRNVRVLDLQNNFHTDWEANGYPTVKPAPAR